jgi:hypothetical protein
MKKLDYLLLIFVLSTLLFYLVTSEIKILWLFKFIIAFIILCLFLYSKVKPIKNNLTSKLKKIYSLIEIIFDKFFYITRKFITPVIIGANTSIDISQIILLIILLILLLL